MSDLTKALEFSPDDETIANVLRDAMAINLWYEAKKLKLTMIPHVKKYGILSLAPPTRNSSLETVTNILQQNNILKVEHKITPLNRVDPMIDAIFWNVIGTVVAIADIVPINSVGDCKIRRTMVIQDANWEKWIIGMLNFFRPFASGMDKHIEGNDTVKLSASNVRAIVDTSRLNPSISSGSHTDTSIKFTFKRYEGTGRSLSLKLQTQLEEESRANDVPAAIEVTDTKAHLLEYPVEVHRVSQLNPLPGCPNFPDMGGSIVGTFVDIQKDLTI